MTHTFIGFDPDTNRRHILVEVHPSLGKDTLKAALEMLKRRLYDNRILYGLMVTPETSYFIRDSLTEITFKPEGYEVKECPTTVLIQDSRQLTLQTENELYFQTRQWLSGVTAAWSSFVPDEALSFMLPYFIGALAGTHLEEQNGLLDIASYEYPNP